MTETKAFHLGDVLSVTTGRLVSHDHIDGVYNILSWMTGEPLMTHQLPRAFEPAKNVILVTFPILRRIEYPEGLETPEDIFEWVDKQAEGFGQWWEIPKIPEGVFEHINPISELVDLMGPDRVHLVEKVE